jgi:putative ATPase
VVATSAALAVERLGMPEARIVLAQAAIYVACAPKSNSAICAIDEATQVVEKEKTATIPAYLMDAHYKGAAKLGHGLGYQYAHNFKNHYVKQQYLPDELKDRVFYIPSDNGYEKQIQEYFKKIKEEE